MKTKYHYIFQMEGEWRLFGNWDHTSFDKVLESPTLLSRAELKAARLKFTQQANAQADHRNCKVKKVRRYQMFDADDAQLLALGK